MTVWLLLIVVFGPVGCSGPTCNELYAVTHSGTFARRTACLEFAETVRKGRLPHERVVCIDKDPSDVIR